MCSKYFNERLFKIPTRQISLPFHILRLVKSLPFHIPEARKKVPLSGGACPYIGHYREYSPPPRGDEPLVTLARLLVCVLPQGFRGKERLLAVYEYSSCASSKVIRDLTFQIPFVSGFFLAIVAASLAVKQTGTKPRAVDNCWLTVEYGIIYWAFVTPLLVSTLRYHA